MNAGEMSRHVDMIQMEKQPQACNVLNLVGFSIHFHNGQSLMYLFILFFAWDFCCVWWKPVRKTAEQRWNDTQLRS